MATMTTSYLALILREEKTNNLYSKVAIKMF